MDTRHRNMQILAIAIFLLVGASFTSMAFMSQTDRHWTGEGWLAAGLSGFVLAYVTARAKS